MTKYHAEKTEVDGILFASKLEAERYTQLKLLQQAGVIVHLKLQPEFQVSRGWVDMRSGEKHRSKFYVGDFLYFDCQLRRWVVEDTKGVETAAFRLKWDCVQSMYPEYDFRVLKREDV